MADGSADLDGLIAQLRDAARSGEVRRGDEVLARLHSQRDPACIPELPGLLDDAVDHHLAFSIIHFAESFEDRPYLSALIAAMPRLVRRSPQWASTVLVRVLNSPAARASCVQACRQAPADQLAAVQLAARGIAERWPEMRPTVDAFLRDAGG